MTAGFSAFSGLGRWVSGVGGQAPRNDSSHRKVQQAQETAQSHQKGMAFCSGRRTCISGKSRIGQHATPNKLQSKKGLTDTGWKDSRLPQASSALLGESSCCQDCAEVYFVGIIDFSIKYSIKKQAAGVQSMG